MQIELQNFGMFTCWSTDIPIGGVVSMPNGTGKTTLINAYVFALSGKTLSGFKARNVSALPDDRTSVVLDINGLEIRRVMDGRGGTTLYLNGDVFTQSAFSEVFPVELAVACANVNILTNPDLTSEQLRKLLALTGVVDSDRSAELRKEKKRVSALRKDAEPYALTNIVVPARTAEPLTDSERRLKMEFEEKNHVMLTEIKKVCPVCGSARSDKDLRHAQNNRDNAKTFCDLYRDEYVRILEKQTAYNEESTKIQTAQTIVDTAVKARRDIIEFDKQLKRIDEELQELDREVISADLPEGVEIVTEQTAKTGRTTAMCSLTYHGVPLKSVNRGRRIKICIELLTASCKRIGKELPILVDNAESVTGLDGYHNVTQFNVSQQW